MVADEMRRDSSNIWQNESIGVAFDTYYDRRSSVNFILNAVGGRMDGQVTNEGTYSGDWNPVWDFAVRRNDAGWTGEMAIPWKSIRYQPQREQVWGLQLRRISRWKNEVSFLTPVPRGLGVGAIFRLSSAATLVGIEAPGSRPPLDIKPYVISDITTDRASIPHVDNRFGKDFGLDVKYAPTRSLTGDFTYNTDFAQVEADEQQVNLTRFSLFFPEKRDFFLENAGIFEVGTNGADQPHLFYSRRIGLDGGREVPLEAGGRLTGRVGAYTVGLINIQTDAVAAAGVPSTNFAVARVRRDVLRRSFIGATATRRSIVSGGTGAGETYGFDGNFAFFENLQFNGFWARTMTPGRTGDDQTYRGYLVYNGDRYGTQYEHLWIGEDFNPEVGFLRRKDFRKNRWQLRFSPRPVRHFRAVRKFTYQVQGEYWTTGYGAKEQREIQGQFHVEFQNSDRIEIIYTDLFERIWEPFEIARGILIPDRPFDHRTFSATYQLGQQHAASGRTTFEYGPFYDGERTALGYTGARIKVNPHFALEPRVSIDRVTLPFGDFTSLIVGSRVTYTITPMMFVSGLVQYNSANSSVGTNLRMRWEYHPGSELFVVYNDGRDTTGPGLLPHLQNRSLVVKVNRLFRF
jgi:hypothetical protein